MKKTLIAIGLLCSSAISTANASNAFHRFSCVEAIPSPDAPQTLDFFEASKIMGYVDYSYNNTLGAKVLIERISCEADREISPKKWKCRGHNYNIHISDVSDDEHFGYVFSIENGKSSASGKVFYDENM